MLAFVLHLVLTAGALLVVAHVVSGVHVSGFGAAVIGALALGLVNAIVRPIMVLLTLPLTILTLGLFLFIVNALMLWLVAALVPGIQIGGYARRYAMIRTSPFLILLLLAGGCDAPPVPLVEGTGGTQQKAATAERGNTGIADDGIFRITPLRPVEELKEEALAAGPPREKGDFREVDLVELTALDPGIKLDVRYATTDNFLSTRLYDEPRAFLQRPAAEALVRAHRAAKEHGYGLLIHDAYRPWWVTRVFWDATPEELRDFVANPAEGSRHNRGCAVDLTLYDLETGEAVQMPGLYDEMTERSYADYTGGTAEQRRRRDLLRKLMEQQGFTVYEKEWWHFDYKDWSQYPIVNLTFEELDAGR